MEIVGEVSINIMVHFIIGNDNIDFVNNIKKGCEY